MYSDIVLDHFTNPRNIGTLENPDRIGVARNNVDGDQVQIHFRLKDKTIVDVKMKVMGCVAAIAATSMLSEMVKGKTIEEIKNINKDSLVKHLGGLPEHKIQCSLTCLDALHHAFPSTSM